MNGVPVTIVMIEDDEGHARLIEKNIRRAGVNNEIVISPTAPAALDYLFGDDGTGAASAQRPLLVLLDLNLPDMTGVDILAGSRPNEHLKRIAGRRADHHRRRGRDPALLRSRLQRLHHQAGELRELRQRDPPARPVPVGDAGSRTDVSHGEVHVLYIDDDPGIVRAGRARARAARASRCVTARRRRGRHRAARPRGIRRDRARPLHAGPRRPR